MMAPHRLLATAQTRLLPPSLPFRFFVAAAVFHALSWVLVLVDPRQAALFAGGPGLTLAAVHAVTLGVLAMTAIGATLQILPVVTGRPIPSLGLARAVWWTFAPGVVLLLCGFAEGLRAAVIVGAGLVGLGLMGFAATVALVLIAAREPRVLVAHLAAALAALLVLVALAVVLIADENTGFLLDRGTVALIHLIVAGFGFMGLLAFGYSALLVPMFTLTAVVPTRDLWIALGLAVPAIAVAAFGLWHGHQGLVVAGALIGLGAVGVHIRAMLVLMRTGMRRSLGLSFVLVRLAWALLPVGIGLGALTAAGLVGPWGGPLFGFIIVYGWLLTFLFGILQRIIPFLAAMNATTPPRLSELADERPLRLHAVCHGGMLVLGTAGIVLGSGPLVGAGAGMGLIGAGAFLWFVAAVVVRMRGRWGDAGPRHRQERQSS